MGVLRMQILSLNYRIIDPQRNPSAFDQVAGRADEQRKKEKSELQPQIHYANPFASIKIMKVFCHEMQIRWQLGLYTVLFTVRVTLSHKSEEIVWRSHIQVMEILRSGLSDQVQI